MLMVLVRIIVLAFVVILARKHLTHFYWNVIVTALYMNHKLNLQHNNEFIFIIIINYIYIQNNNMSGINTPFPVDSIVLGEVVGPIFAPSPLPPNCFAQGILTKHGHLDPSVPAHVVKIEAGAGEASAASAAGTAGASLRVFALHGNFSVAGVAALPAYPATALSATFSRDGRVSNAVFGNIDRVDESNIIIHTLHGIRASFSPANGRCTKVCIDDTYWMPWTPHDCTTIKTSSSVTR